ncbi:thioredoxin family protein [Pontibacter sp. G13]|uniref:peroxiredoxin family protein n=1 Tax=Pontibacter sp. G13 TaxID=3074898 RepID=UPI00288B6ED2|nr:thioredoxin family protein [Pontibacter sp. G13]WNJ16624.1 thioredoxin family protein [Pontibacter sp. G13]
MFRPITTIVGVSLLLFGAITSCAQSHPGPQEPEAASSLNAQAPFHKGIITLERPPDPKLGELAPDFSIIDMDGVPQSVHGIEATYTLLYFWDYECKRSMSFAPLLTAALEDYKAYDIKLMSVNINGDETVWKERVKALKLDQDYMVPLHDPYLKSGFAQLYAILSTPRLFILDKDKKLVARWISVEMMREILDHELGIERPAEPESENASEEVKSAGQ